MIEVLALLLLILGVPSLAFVIGAILGRQNGFRAGVRVGIANERAKSQSLLEEARDCIRQDEEEIEELERQVRELRGL